MKRKRIKHIIHGIVSNIGALCAAVDEAFDMEAIHRFRLAAKSLRSFLRLQKMYTGNKKIRLPDKFKRLYDIAGVIREAQLELAFLEHKPALPHYASQLQKAIKWQQAEWTLYYNPKIIKHLDKKLAAHKYKKMHPDALERFFKNRKMHIDQLATAGAHTDEDIHDARKKIKDIVYTAKIAGKEWKYASKNGAVVKELNSLSDLMGDYNDERTLVTHIKEIDTGNMERSEKSNLKHLKDREAKKLRKKKDAVIAAVRTYQTTVHDKD